MVSFANKTSVDKPSKQPHGFESCTAIVVCVSVHPLHPQHKFFSYYLCTYICTSTCMYVLVTVSFHSSNEYTDCRPESIACKGQLGIFVTTA